MCEEPLNPLLSRLIVVMERLGGAGERVAREIEQVTGRVRWRESVLWLANEGGVTRFAEAGAGKVLSGMAKRIAPDVEATPLNTPADLEAFAASLKG